MSDDSNDPLWDELQQGVGKPMGEPSFMAPFPINDPMIRHWVDAFTDRNPAYGEPEVAATTRFGETIAPPASLQAWASHRPVIDGIRERGGSSVDFSEDNVLKKLDAAGFTAVVASNCELEFEQVMKVGDQLRVESELESVSNRKKTALGHGYFVTWINSYYNQRDELAGREIFRVFKFDPSTYGQK